MGGGRALGFWQVSRAGAAFFWPGVEPSVMKRARDCAPSPCSSFMEGAFLRKTLGQLSPANTDDAFWSIGDTIQSCDKGMLDFVRLSQPKGNEQALSLLQTLPQPPLERLFGPAGKHRPSSESWFREHSFQELRVKDGTSGRGCVQPAKKLRLAAAQISADKGRGGRPLGIGREIGPRGIGCAAAQHHLDQRLFGGPELGHSCS
jgi:hypothetical protein